MTRKPGRPAIPNAATIDDVAGMAILAGPIAAITSRKHEAPAKPEDPLRQDWKELTFTDSWNLPAVYDFGANELLARELDRWAKVFGGPYGRQLRRRAAYLRASKTPGADT